MVFPVLNHEKYRSVSRKLGNGFGRPVVRRTSGLQRRKTNLY
nr:MAG TPA: hypothetical protein [Caudoviricetes sp.]